MKNEHDLNPQGLELSPKPKVFGISRKPLVIVAILMSVLFIPYLIFMQQKNASKKEDEQKGVYVERPAFRGLVDGNYSDQGIIQQEMFKQKDIPQGVIENSAPVEGVRIVTVTMPDKNQQTVSQVDTTELEDVRRMQMEAYRNAIRAPLAIEVKRNSETAQAEQTGQASAASASVNMGNTARMPQGITAPEAQWQLGHQRSIGRTFELKTGTVIPAVLTTGINSDLAGSVTAQVSQNVYDSTTGQHLLIPQGSKLYGDYASAVAFGQDRLFVSWKRVLFPDGSSISLGAMAGSDQAGYSGFNDQVNNHYFKIFGTAILMSAITGGITYSVDQLDKDNNNNNDSNTNLRDELSMALAQQIGQVSMNLLQKHLNVSPTIEIRAGYKFSIVATKDIVFANPYFAIPTQR